MKKYIRDIKRNFDLYLIVMIPIIYLIIFKYYPMYGVQIAFRRFNITDGITGSPWVGLLYFKKFINSYLFWIVIKNTFFLALYGMIAGFPLPIILALMLNYCDNQKYKKIVQMTTYAPHFISVVVLCGMLFQFFSPRYGIINNIIDLLGGERVDIFANPNNFRNIYVWSSIWQGMGWSSIIYIAVLSGVDPQLHEAAVVDGANILHRMWHIDLPAIVPTATILMIMSCGRLMSVGFEKVLLLQNGLNLSKSQVIQTYVYQIGFASELPNFSYSAAIGLFTSIISFILLVSVNTVAKRIGNTSLW